MLRALALFVLMVIPVAAAANPGRFTARLTVFLGGGPVSPAGNAQGLRTIGSGFLATTLIDQPLSSPAVTAGVFSGNQFLPSATAQGGTVPLPTSPNTLYVLGQVVNHSSGAGSFAPGRGPAGGFGGTLDLGMVVRALIGLSPHPNVFGSVVLPLGAGSPGTQTGMALILGNPVTATAYGTGWTTGQIRYGTGILGTQLATAGTVTGSRTIGTSFNSHPTNPTLGAQTLQRQIFNLVTPILVHVAVNGTPIQVRVGYAKLRLDVVQVFPEPALAVLLLAGGLCWIGRSRGARRQG